VSAPREPAARRPGVAPQAYRGEAIGLPPAGPGSLASTAARIGAFLVDAIASGLVAALFVSTRHVHSAADRLPGSWSLIPLGLDYVVGILVAGRTVGMYLFGLRVVRVRQPQAAVDPGRAVVRTVLTMLLLPVIVFDRDGRGLHDRFADTAVVRA
jgi:uncharacterized RDD family membrane protein YckC